MKVLDVRWFSGQHCIGIARVQTEYDGIKYYIGLGWGQDEQTDISYIAEHGSTFPYDVGEMLFGISAYRNG